MYDLFVVQLLIDCNCIYVFLNLCVHSIVSSFILKFLYDGTLGNCTYRKYSEMHVILAKLVICDKILSFEMIPDEDRSCYVTTQNQDRYEITI